MGSTPKLPRCHESARPKMKEDIMADDNAQAQALDELVDATRKGSKANTERVYAEHPIAKQVRSVNPEAPVVPQELTDVLAAHWNLERIPRIPRTNEPAFVPDGPARWIARESIFVTQDAQIRGGQDRKASAAEFAQVYWSNPLAVPPFAVTEIPEAERAQYNGLPYLLDDGFARMAGITEYMDKTHPWAIVPAYVIPAIKGKSALMSAKYVAAALNNTEHPDDMDSGAMRLTALDLLAAGFRQADVAARLGIADSNLSDWVRIKWTQERLLEAGVPSEVISPKSSGKDAGQCSISDRALLFAYKLLTSDVPPGTEPEDEKRMRVDRILTCVHLCKNGYKSVGQWKAVLEGWMMDPSIVVKAREANIVNATGSKKGPASNGAPKGTTGGNADPATIERLMERKAEKDAAIEAAKAKLVDPSLAPEERQSILAEYSQSIHDSAALEHDVRDARMAPREELAVDPYHRFGSAIVGYLHGDTTDAEVFAMAQEARITADQMGKLLKVLGKARESIEKAETEEARRQVEKDSKEPVTA